ncbi:uncharacterized protein LOC113005537 isoform X1 [Solenopsis invicta]|uniref:uncharacterized protein LOC113005537 isoform X1 n=1 Tax=Solenopsis invicta TaxID=13686 RepID=UPI00193E6D39|nr:uncharacterized protein LOC113005537 isoform X1 [Solenopsis invicta]
MQLNNSEIPKNATFCSLHFQETDLDRTSLACVRVKPGALPHKNVEIDNRGLATKGVKLFNNNSLDINQNHDDTERNCSTPHRQLNNRPDSLDDTPRKRMLRTVLKNTRERYKKKVKILQQKQRRSTKRIATLKEILKSLKQKNLLNAEQVDVLKDLGMFNQQLLKRQISRIKKSPGSKMYEPELRMFALTLHFYSPRAYTYVRKKFNTALPHPKTICKWYKSVNGEPGFNKEALESIKTRAEQVDYPLFGALIFDEMSIRQHIEYDGNKYSGYVDLGSEINCDSGAVAKRP